MSITITPEDDGFRVVVLRGDTLCHAFTPWYSGVEDLTHKLMLELLGN